MDTKFLGKTLVASALVLTTLGIKLLKRLKQKKI